MIYTIYNALWEEQFISSKCSIYLSFFQQFCIKSKLVMSGLFVTFSNSIRKSFLLNAYGENECEKYFHNQGI